MSYLENEKQYTGSELEQIFFRPMLTGPSAEELGVRILYNMPTPTYVQLWFTQENILQKYSSTGWSGSKHTTKVQKPIDLKRVKAELGFAAADYFSMVYEKIVSGADVNMGDLTGTQLEEAETALFKQLLAENIRATMWLGDSSAADGFNTFDGFLKMLKQWAASETIYNVKYTDAELKSPDAAVTIFDTLWENASGQLQDAKSEGQLAYFVTSDIYRLYEKYLDQKGVDSAYTGETSGRAGLAYHGIPVIDLHLGSYLGSSTTLDKSFCFLTDRRNLVLAVNTADFPGNEVRMWYNPDEMENRQRAVFMAGCTVLDSRMVAYAAKS